MIYDALKDIRNAQKNGNLVIFVGAGVSANSGLPSWKALVENIAKVIDYEIEDTLSSDLMLRIPEYYYHYDPTDNKSNYYSFLESYLSEKDYTSNALDELIVNLLPHHIVTTNYDHLLENSNTANTNAYQVVFNDRGLLENNSQRYILKMHGDLIDSESIVLRETDYLQYEQSHPIISNYIKSLLADHVFLYVGYGLNDYNLNIIISWINYYYERYGINYKNNNYICVKNANPFEEKRYSSKGIQIIDLSQLNKNDVEKLNEGSGLTHDTGKRLYAFLSMIKEDRLYYPLSLSEKLSVFTHIKRISIFDFFKTLNFPIVTHVALQVMVKDDYAKQLSKIYCEDEFGKSIIIKTGLSGIGIYPSEEFIRFKENSISEITDDYLLLWLDNRFSKLKETIEGNNEDDVKLHYYPVLGYPCDSIDSIINSIDDNYEFESYPKLVLDKARALLATNNFGLLSEKKRDEFFGLIRYIPDSILLAVGLVLSIVKEPDYLSVKTDPFLKKQEEKYKNTTTWYSETSDYQIWRMQSYVYDYYFFCKLNNLPIETIGWIRKQFGLYVKAMMCSYQPLSNTTGVLGIAKTDLNPYVLNVIDYDILTKMPTPKTIRKIVNEYHIADIKFESNVKPVNKFCNLCHELIGSSNHIWYEYFYNSLLVLSHTSLKDVESELIVKSIIDFLDNSNNCKDMDSKLFYDSLLHFTNCKTFSNSKLAETLLNSLIDYHENNSHNLDNCYWYILDNLSKYKTKDVEEKVSLIIENTAEESKPSLISKYHRLLNENELKNNIKAYCEGFNITDLFTLYFDGCLNEYDGIIDALQMKTINAIKSRELEIAQGMHSYPDYAEMAIESFLYLFLEDKVDDIAFLFPFADQSDYISFFEKEECFDFSLVNINERLWQRIAISDKYNSLFKSHLSEIIDDELWRKIRANKLTKNLNIVLYHYLLDEDDLKQI